jgi:hypothetical protein
VKRITLLVLLCAAMAVPAFSQETAELKDGNWFTRAWGRFTTLLFTPQVHKPFSVGGGIEVTQNERSGVLPEISAVIDFEYSRYVALGVRGGLTVWSRQSTDSLVSSMDALGFARFYPYDFGWIRPFVQAGVGISEIREVEYEVYDPIGEAALGARAHLTGWYLEAIFRYGYPFRFAGGLFFGHSFLP